jgi:SSS family solute:Na+ symporter
MQATVNWAFCVLVCTVVSLLTPPPPPEKVTDVLTFNLRRLNIGAELGGPWYRSVVFYWCVFVGCILSLLLLLSGLFV